MQPRNGVSNLFFALLVQDRPIDEIVSHANGSTFLEISKSNFREIPLIMPWQAVLEAYHLAASDLHDKIVANEHESRSLSAQRDALLPGLVGGAVGVGEDVNQGS